MEQRRPARRRARLASLAALSALGLSLASLGVVLPAGAATSGRTAATPSAPAAPITTTASRTTATHQSAPVRTPSTSGAKLPHGSGGTDSTYLVTFVARECPSYADVTANLARNNIQESLQDLGGDTAYTPGQPISPSVETPNQPNCSPLDNWQFTLGNGIAGVGPQHLSVVSSPSGTYTVQPSVPLLTPQGTPTGQQIADAVTVALTPAQVNLAMGHNLWAQGGTPSDPLLTSKFGDTYGFAALRCGIDNLNGDNVEWIGYPTGQTNMFCYYYAVNPSPVAGTIIIKKQLGPGQTGTSTFQFNGNMSYNPGGDFAITVGGAAPSSGSYTFVRAGGQTWDATELPAAGFADPTISCTSAHGTSISTVTGATVSIALGDADTVTCTYTDVRNAVNLSIFHQTVGGVGGPFGATVTGPGGSPTVSGTATTTGELTPVLSVAAPDLAPGVYTVTQTLPAPSPAGVWSVTGFECDGVAQPPSLTEEVTVTASKESLSCTYTNTLTALGSLTLTKTTVGGTGTVQFAVSPVAGSGDPSGTSQLEATTTQSGVPATATLVSGPSLAALDFGQYVISETGPTNTPLGYWISTSIVCSAPYTDNGFASVVVTVAAASPNVTCDFSNTFTPYPVTILKSNTPGSVAVGDNSTYTLAVTIPAGAYFYNLSAFDLLPDGLAFDALKGSTCTNADSTPCTVSATALGVNPQPDGTSYVNFYLGDSVTSVPQERVVTITYTAHPTKTFYNGEAVGPGTSLTNYAGLYWNATLKAPPTSSTLPGDFDVNGPTSSATLSVAAPELSIAKAVSNATPAPGDQFTYTVTLGNGAGPDTSPAYDVTVTDALPAGLAAPTNISDGGTFAAGGSGAGTITWLVAGPVAPGSSVSLTYTATLAASETLTPGQALVNTASVTQYFDSQDASGGDPSRYITYAPVPPALTATASVTPQFPALTITKTTSTGASSGIAELGMPFGWIVTVTNGAGPPASGITVTDTLPPGWTYDQGSTNISGPGGATILKEPSVSEAATGDTLTWTDIGTLEASQAFAVGFTATPTAAAILGSSSPNTNSASTTWTDGAGGTGTAGGAYAAGPATATATVDAADMSITKTHEGDFPIGSDATFTLAVTNNGPNPASGVTVTDDVPDGLTPTSVTPANPANWTCTIAGQTVTCDYALPTFAVGTTEQIDVTSTVLESAYPSVTNTATVSSTTPDQNTSNNTATDTAKVTRPALSLVKRVTGITDVNRNGYHDAGDIIKYQLIATNIGDATEFDVRIEDPMLGALSCAPAQPVNLAPGEQLSCKGNHTITEADVKAGKVTNTAIATGKDGAGTIVPSPPASVVTPVSSPPSGGGGGSSGGNGGGGSSGGGSSGGNGGGGLAFTGGPTFVTMGAILAMLLVGMALLVVSRRRPAHARRRHHR